jgi:WD40 repeat protein
LRRTGHIRVWDLESGEVAFQEARCTQGLELTADGRLVSSGPRELRLWNLEDGSSTLLRERDAAVAWLAVSADGRYVLTSEVDSWDFTAATSRLLLLDLQEGSAEALSSHGNRVFRVAFDPTGQVVVTGDLDGVVRASPATGGEPHLLTGHEGMVVNVAVSPDGRWIASAGSDGTIRLWPMPDVSARPLHALPYEELLARVGALTNLRAVPDEESPAGYKIEPGPFPGWEQMPFW